MFSPANLRVVVVPPEVASAANCKLVAVAILAGAVEGDGLGVGVALLPPFPPLL